MLVGTSKDDPTPRRETIGEAISILVRKLGTRESVCALVACADRVDGTTGEHDTEAEAEQEEDPDEGGLRTITFAGGKAHDIGAWMGV